jgi:hypothetical protein
MFDLKFEEFCSEMEQIETPETIEEISLQEWIWIENCSKWENRLMEDGLI